MRVHKKGRGGDRPAAGNGQILIWHIGMTNELDCQIVSWVFCGRGCGIIEEEEWM
jgi:hypothetical protein